MDTILIRSATCARQQEHALPQMQPFVLRGWDRLGSSIIEAQSTNRSSLWSAHAMVGSLLDLSIRSNMIIHGIHFQTFPSNSTLAMIIFDFWCFDEFLYVFSLFTVCDGLS